MTRSAVEFSRRRMLDLLLVGIFGIGAVGVAVLAADAPAAAMKPKKCTKCKRKPFVIKPDSITLLAG